MMPLSLASALNGNIIYGKSPDQTELRSYVGRKLQLMNLFHLFISSGNSDKKIWHACINNYNPAGGLCLVLGSDACNV